MTNYNKMYDNLGSLLKQNLIKLEDFLVILERMKANNLGADEILRAELDIQNKIYDIEENQ